MPAAFAQGEGRIEPGQLVDDVLAVAFSRLFRKGQVLRLCKELTSSSQCIYFITFEVIDTIQPHDKVITASDHNGAENNKKCSKHYKH